MRAILNRLPMRKAALLASMLGLGCFLLLLLLAENRHLALVPSQVHSFRSYRTADAEAPPSLQLPTMAAAPEATPPQPMPAAPSRAPEATPPQPTPAAPSRVPEATPPQPTPAAPTRAPEATQPQPTPAAPSRAPEATPPQPTTAAPSRAPEATPPQPQEEPAGLVRIIHQSWKTNQLPTRFHRWSLSFSSCQPNWQRKLWTDEDNVKLVADHFSWFLPTYRKLSQSVQKADVSRLFYMYKYGGLYCDLDCECLNPFEHLLGNVSLAFGAMEGHTTGPQDERYVDEGQIENSFMYSIPGHPFIMELIKQVEKSPHGSPEDTTGPYLLMRAIHRIRKSKAGFPKEFRGKKYLEIFPPSFFNPFSWISNRVPDCKDKGGLSLENEVKCREAHRNSSYILQYHTQVWLAGKSHLNKD